MENYLGAGLMGTIRGGGLSGASGISSTGGGKSGLSSPTASAIDYQAIYDNAQPYGTQFPPGQSGYTRRAGPAGSVILEPAGRMGAPSYQITTEGAVYAKPVRPDASFQPVAGAGTVRLAQPV